MAVIEVLTFAVKPGRLEEFLADVRQLAQVLARVDVCWVRSGRATPSRWTRWTTISVTRWGAMGGKASNRMHR